MTFELRSGVEWHYLCEVWGTEGPVCTEAGDERDPGRLDGRPGG